MHDPTDETLMAYADGLLDEAQGHALEARLAVDPVLQQRLQPFVVTGKPLARLFNSALSAEVPSRLLDTIFETPAPRAATERGPARTVNRSWDFRSWPAWFGSDIGGPLRLAGMVSACLAVGVVAGWLARGEFSAPVGGPGALMLVTARGTMARGDLAAALEGATSATPVRGRDETGASMTVRPRVTFIADGGAICRQYHLQTGGPEAFGGLACRTAEGDWRIEVHAPAAAMPDSREAVRTASGDVAPAAVEGAIDKMIRSDPMTVDDEKELIRRNWTRNSGR